ncbi:hypothetical protein JM93_03291 [Roseibium hamelinense]|uniref:Uncharacterized protein n=1 Tax=Roseibium hamelinense TaxID=150831 RepID=A0A562SN80_9HYPH|nr:hypothetical protein [Roseibium hamelinense]MTI44016.1 hypothetical protein [Roseibium hamelinense]TWI82777.1 hypothetical protein JM93_03291 [Roseibium hamelinense]
MPEPRSSATLRALADLADLSATQLQEGRSVEEVIDVLRKAAAAVRVVVSTENKADLRADSVADVDFDPVVIDNDDIPEYEKSSA